MTRLGSLMFATAVSAGGLLATGCASVVAQDGGPATKSEHMRCMSKGQQGHEAKQAKPAQAAFRCKMMDKNADPAAEPAPTHEHPEAAGPTSQPTDIEQ